VPAAAEQSGEHLLGDGASCRILAQAGGDQVAQRAGAGPTGFWDCATLRGARLTSASSDQGPGPSTATRKKAQQNSAADSPWFCTGSSASGW